MNFISLESFVAAKEEMNFTKAAKRLYVSQQSLSGHIAKLEEYYGIKLFDRNPPLTATQAGESLYQYAKEMLDTKKQSEQALRDIKDFRNSNLKIGISYYRSNAMLPMILPEYHKHFPNVSLELLEGKLADVTAALYMGKVDFVLGYKSPDTKNIKSEILYEEKLMIAIPENIFHGYFSVNDQRKILLRKRLKLEELAHCPFIKMGKNTWTAGLFESYCQEKDFDLQAVLETSSITAMVSLCVAGLGIIVCPDIYLTDRELRKEKLDKLKIFELDYAMNDCEIAINFLKNKYQTQAAKEFIKMAKQVFVGPL